MRGCLDFLYVNSHLHQIEMTVHKNATIFLRATREYQEAALLEVGGLFCITEIEHAEMCETIEENG